MPPRMRTINEAIAELKRLDPGCAITAHYLRQLCIEGASFTMKVGQKYLINLDKLFEHLTGNSDAA